MLIMLISDLPKFLISDEHLKFYPKFIISTLLKFVLKNERFSKHQKTHISAYLKLHFLTPQKCLTKMIFLTHFSKWLKPYI